MATMNPKDFINTVFVHETGDLANSHHYIAFMVMGMGIEFLGRCLDSAAEEWHEEMVSRKRFEEAVNKLKALEKYRELIGKNTPFDLYGSLRCGLVHSGAPKYEITLSSKGEMGHMVKHTDGNRINLRCEDFYVDFKQACEEVINHNFPDKDKMNKSFLSVPDYPMDASQQQTAVTESSARSKI